MSAVVLGTVIFAAIVLGLLLIVGVVLAIVLGRASRTTDSSERTAYPPAEEQLNPQAFQPPAVGIPGGDSGGITP
ncbi:hypothetical protein [Microbacterium suaedae]|uniref:hypothetical protein n=1 Tax=Microbacterium suaedae TaxID=2067813 RepID=UPI000DA1A06C|nr:hypothetical protein [Microbacterium suaedae]